MINFREIIFLKPRVLNWAYFIPTVRVDGFQRF